MSEDSGEKVPLWIISFADMITLLLSFFVMLQTMAHSQDATLFGASQDSFRRAIAGLGIPDLLFGKETGPTMDYRKLRYPVEPAGDNENTSRVIDADDEQIRKLFSEISKQVETRTVNTSEKLLQVLAVPVSFDMQDSLVDEGGRQYLEKFAANLKHSLRSEGTRIYVVGLCGEEVGARQQLMASARRASSVARLLESLLAEKDLLCKWRVHCWGAGASTRLLEMSASVPGKSSILIAVTGASKDHG